ncbi:MAG: hypothetical protein PVH61_39220 [Candidatus Aminicenantes bacterium]|jgi:hypothetical protein
MNIISQLDEAQEKQIPFYIEKWRDKCLLTAPITPTLFEQGLRDIHEELGMEAPREFLYYLSPAAMWREFEVWKPKITRVLTQFWRYQIPLCDPSSMHRRFGAGSKRFEFNFAAKRYLPGPNYTLWETEDSDETSGPVIKKGLHGQLWKRFQFETPVGCRFFSYFPCDYNETIDDYLYERADKEDPTNQMHYWEYCFIGPEQWLLRELACVDFCHRVLDINRNERLYSGLEAIVENGSFCGVFGCLCVACERPHTIEVENKNFKFTFPDGEVISL